MKPIKFEKVTNKYISEKINELNINCESKEFLKGKLFYSLKKRKLYFKDLKAINFSVRKSPNTGKATWQIAVYATDSYYTIEND